MAFNSHVAPSSRHSQLLYLRAKKPSPVKHRTPINVPSQRQLSHRARGLWKSIVLQLRLPTSPNTSQDCSMISSPSSHSGMALMVLLRNTKARVVKIKKRICLLLSDLMIIIWLLAVKRTAMHVMFRLVDVASVVVVFVE